MGGGVVLSRMSDLRVPKILYTKMHPICSVALIKHLFQLFMIVDPYLSFAAQEHYFLCKETKKPQFTCVLCLVKIREHTLML